MKRKNSKCPVHIRSHQKRHSRDTGRMYHQEHPVHGFHARLMKKMFGEWAENHPGIKVPGYTDLL